MRLTGRSRYTKTFPIPNSRFPIPDSQFPIPDSRFPNYSDIDAVANSRNHST
ncbi:hypothetical protein [Moorena producens]|uniref:hypothetical protein n=1 Tax=Moorena producens TaxID=1155739 RepID=UPI0002F7FF8A|nr:hypothetical protein [Moorena producens]